MGYIQLMLALQADASETSESEWMDVVDEEISMQMPITVDGLYNLVVCEECGIGIPLEWVKGHLKDHHGVRKTEEDLWRKMYGERCMEKDVPRKLYVDQELMTMVEAKDCIKSVWVGRVVQGILMTEGWR
jgi:hypothetical protein